MASRWSSRVHVAILLMVLSAYATWSLWSSFGRGPRLQIFGGIFASAAVFGVVTRQRWARPVVYSLGVLMILEWLGYTIEALRSGYPFPDSSWLSVALAFVPGVVLAAAIGYCCFVVSRYV